MQNKLKIINDPVHGFIKIPFELLFDVIEHPFFQRLRRIGQTGLLSQIFPGANHTRFHHALGAMHLMFSALETLKLKGVEISVKEEQSALLAILLHDIGHGPFSHALESMLLEDWHHEKLSLLLMQELNREFSGELSTAIEMFQGRYHRGFFNQLISSQLDVDRMDYLKRDSFFTGVSEGNVNSERIISMMNVCRDELVIDQKGVYSIENYLTARMFMYWQVYYHKTAALSEHMLVKILRRARELSLKGEALKASEDLSYFLKKPRTHTATAEDLLRFTRLDDNDIIQAMKFWQHASDPLLSYLCTAVVQRRMLKTQISSAPFPTDTIDALVRKSGTMLPGIPGKSLVGEISRTLLPYSKDLQPIYLMRKDQSLVRLNESENQILSSSMVHPTTKYILYYPREIV